VLLDRRCVVCDKEYQTHHNKSKYCSRVCKGKIAVHETRVCLVCGQNFNTRKYGKAKHCSVKCAKNAFKVPMQEGYIVYLIKNKLNNKIYVGSTKKFKIRIIQHKSDLKLNRHNNSRLQYDWNLYGLDSFDFISVEENIKPEQRYEREQYYIDYYDLNNPSKGYNIAVNAEKSMKNRKHSKESLELMSVGHKNISNETRLKMSRSQKGKKRAAESIEKSASKLRGIPKSEEAKRKSSMTQSGSKSIHSKLSHEDVLDIKERLSRKEKQKDIAEAYGVHDSVISKISNNKAYKEELPCLRSKS